MNSKEALEFLTEGICNCPNCSKYVECMDLDESESVCENAKFIIKKDLIKLEQLKKENQELRKAVKSWNENGEKLIRENTKLKKALDILISKKVDVNHLKNTKDFNGYNRTRHFYEADYLMEEEYELLKEVLDCD